MPAGHPKRPNCMSLTYFYEKSILVSISEELGATFLLSIDDVRVLRDSLCSIRLPLVVRYKLNSYDKTIALSKSKLYLGGDIVKNKCLLDEYSTHKRLLVCFIQKTNRSPLRLLCIPYRFPDFPLLL
jgi:hypothetical protein